RTPFFAWFSGYHAEETIADIVLAVTSLSTRRTGALIVLERREGLKNYIENGVRLDSAVSYDLLVTVFAPGTPLHDGAVILSGERVAAAACFLPLSLNEGLSKRFGTRHRAAIGITEETDALAVVVSEERGTISVARNGEMIEDLDGKGLRDLLLRESAAA
ncbi:MAG: DNA integrity scanning protein DisA nucleotide-binding domain protein, partial [Acidobacteriota bacterium]|nr:DNA integrity scanning protein DisA nucleotide-binding domain protein [Acidobacteriota bacterium]